MDIEYIKKEKKARKIMTIWVALILGIVQGLTEFLPVSSSGHLALLGKLFGISEGTLLLTILLHVATLLAVLFVLRKEIWELIKHPFSREACNLYLATIPTVLIVLVSKGFFDDTFENSKLLPYFFLLTAILLLVTYFISKRQTQTEMDYPKNGFKRNNLSSLVMGAAQGLAVLPGISRSGSTICAGLLCGEERSKVAKFSFLMSIPVILGSLLFEIVKGDFGVLAAENMALPTIVAFISAFVVGILSMKFMLKIVEKGKYYYFSIYLIALSILAFFVV